jgi:hypothetical protein
MRDGGILGSRGFANKKQPFSVIARSPCDEAIQGLRDAGPKPVGAVRRPLDCFALLAMTG